jgi:uncharacterized membrane protein
MRTAFAFLKNTAIGGALFLLPVALAVFLIGHLLAVLRPPVAKAAAFVGQAGISPFWLTVVLVVLLLAVAFLAGLIAATAIGRLITERLEALVLQQVPGYRLLKRAASDAASSVSAIDAAERDRAVMIRDGDGWRIGFVMENVGDRGYAVFVPDAPTPETGAVLFVGRDQIAESGLNTAEALACIRRLGTHSPKLVVPAFS